MSSYPLITRTVSSPDADIVRSAASCSQRILRYVGLAALFYVFMLLGCL